MGDKLEEFLRQKRVPIAVAAFAIILLGLVLLFLNVVPFFVSAWDGTLQAAAHLASVVVAIVIVVSAIIAIWTILSANRRARRASSFEHIARQTRDRELIEMFEEFRQVKQALGKRFKTLNGRPFGVEHVEGQEVSYHKAMLSADDVLKKVFNYYEATGIGIDTDALDDRHIKRWWRGTYVLDFCDFAAFVYEKRLISSAPKLYIEYETVVRRWATPDEMHTINLAKEEAERAFGHLKRS